MMVPVSALNPVVMYLRMRILINLRAEPTLSALREYAR